VCINIYIFEIYYMEIKCIYIYIYIYPLEYCLIENNDFQVWSDDEDSFPP